MARIELSNAADADLEAILAYSVEQFGYDVADAYMQDIERVLERLADYPELGPVQMGLRQRPRCLTCREHRIFYRFEGEIVFVGRILHKAMDPSRWLT